MSWNRYLAELLKIYNCTVCMPLYVWIAFFMFSNFALFVLAANSFKSSIQILKRFECLLLMEHILGQLAWWNFIFDWVIWFLFIYHLKLCERETRLVVSHIRSFFTHYFAFICHFYNLKRSFLIYSFHLSHINYSFLNIHYEMDMSVASLTKWV